MMTFPKAPLDPQGRLAAGLPSVCLAGMGMGVEKDEGWAPCWDSLWVVSRAPFPLPYGQRWSLIWALTFSGPGELPKSSRQLFFR